MPVNGPPPGRRPPAPMPPPRAPNMNDPFFQRKGPPPDPPPMRYVVTDQQRWWQVVISWALLIAVIVAFSFAMAYGFKQQTEDVSAWAKDVDYRHCWGKFDTPACHERKAKENAKAYTEYEGNK